MDNNQQPLNKNNREEQVTNNELLSVLNDAFGKIDERFEKIDERFDKMDKRFDRIEQRLDILEKEVTRIGAVMVDKDYLDRKLADMRADIGSLIRKEDYQIAAFIDKMAEKKFINENESHELKIMGPFVKKESVQ
jgi:hypothetical protein